MSKTAGWLVLIAVAAVLGHWLFPRTIPGPPPPPRIVTVWDTVDAVDTLWITRLADTVVRVDTITLTERVTVSYPDTVAVCPDIIGVTAVAVPEAVGESTLVGGFILSPLDSGGVTVRSWESQVWTAGPLRGILVHDTLPPSVVYWPQPSLPRTCGFWCQASRFGLGSLAGFAACAVTQ